MKKNSKKINILACFLAILAGMTAVVFLINKIAFCLSGFLADSEEGEIYGWEYGDIHYLKKGRGKPLLLVHDTGSLSSAQEWRKIVSHLEKDHCVYCMDLPCHGRSYAEKMIYTNYIYARSICDFARDVIGEKTDIVCSNEAGSIAIMAARNDPELFERMLLINPEAPEHMNREQSLSERILSTLMMLPLVGTAIYVALTTRPLISAKLRQDYFESPEMVDSHALDICSAAARMGGENKRFALASSMGRFTDLNIVFALRECRHRVLLIGGRSREKSREVLDFYMHFLPNAESVVLAGKNMPHLEYPVETAETIEDFLCHGR